MPKLIKKFKNNEIIDSSLIYDNDKLLNKQLANYRKVLNQMPSVSGEGSEIILDHTIDAELLELEIQGNTYQDTSKMFYKCDGTETGTYYFTYDSVNYQFTMPEVEDGDLLIFDIDTLVLSLNEAVISTETGTEGTLLTLSTSPNKDYPQKIEKVSGNVSIKIENKNLCTKIQRQDNSNLRFYINNKFIEKTFTIAFTSNVNLSSNSLYLMLDGTSVGLISQISATANTRTNKSITLSDANFKSLKNAQTAYILLYKNNAGFTLPTDAQIENGSATSYIPHEEQIVSLNLPEGMEMCKIGDYADSFVKQEGKWYKATLVRKLELAIADMNNSEDYPGWKNQTQMANDYPSTNKQFNLVTSYKQNLGAEYVSINTVSKDKIVYLNKTLFGGLNQTQIKEQYPDLVFVMCYGLQSPDLQEITDPTLIKQLNKIKSLCSYYGTTYITATADNVNPIIKAKAIKDLNYL